MPRQDTPRQDTSGGNAASSPQEPRSERSDGRGRGRRGRRRGRRGSGGGREGVGSGGGADATTGENPQLVAAGEAASGNGRHDTPPAQTEQGAREPAQDYRPPEPPAREYHAGPAESGPAHEGAPIAHFEPSPKPEQSSAGKPYVVWSSAPAEKDGGNRGPEE
jgi:ribonuclease E